MVRETGVQSQFESYQWLKKILLDAFLINTQYYKVWIKDKWSNPGKEVVLSPTPRWNSYWKREPLGHPQLLWVTLNQLITLLMKWNKIWPKSIKIAALNFRFQNKGKTRLEMNNLCNKVKMLSLYLVESVPILDSFLAKCFWQNIRMFKYSTFIHTRSSSAQLFLYSKQKIHLKGMICVCWGHRKKLMVLDTLSKEKF